MKPNRTTYALFVATLATVGCGGGSSATNPASAQAHNGKAGNAVFTYFGAPKPLTATSSNNVSVLTQAGATFSSVQLQPAPNLDTTSLALGRVWNDYSETGIYKIPYGSAVQQLLYQNEDFIAYPGASVYGNVVFSDQLLFSSKAMGSVRIDGTGFTSLPVNITTEELGAKFATDGTNRLAFEANNNLYVVAGSGGTATQIQTATDNGQVAWNPVGTKILYSAYTNSGASADLFQTSPSGGTPTIASPTGLAGTGFFADAAWSPDGSSIAATFNPSGAPTTEIVLFNINNFGAYVSVTGGGDSDSVPTFSPDGSKLIFYRLTSSAATSGLYECDSNGGNVQLYMADPADMPGIAGLSWTPFLPKETVVAASGATFYHKAASGFLYAMNKDQFGSFVAFTATTPSTAAIQAPSGGSVGGAAPLVFTVTADSITSLGYTNSYFNPGTTLTLTSTPTVVVSVDAVTGQVDVVAPAAEAKPSLTKNADGSVTYKATFKAIYDGKGANQAPSGAKSITVNPKTGKLLSWS